MALLAFRGEDMLASIPEILRNLKYFLVSGKPLLRLSLASRKRQWTQQRGQIFWAGAVNASPACPPQP
ncbi:hypothetical protein M3A49_00610 [Paraburkholderia sp. CNPSo 3076]|nr:hypothetical protein [Paraburkholderia sp. CNPSo 3076]